jgi:hypothetical protein
MNLFACLAIVLLAHVATAQLAPRIDTFATEVSVMGIQNTTAIVTPADGTFLGTSRTVIAEGVSSSPSFTVTCEITNERFALSADALASGSCMAMYDDIPQEDLISLGCCTFPSSIACTKTDASL